MADFNSNNIALYNNKKYEILTPDGFKKFDGVLKGTNKLLHIILNNNMWLKCTPLHKIIISLDKPYCEANKLKIGDDVLTCDGIQTIKSIDEIYDDNNVYEIFNVHDNHSYISNGIYSSQCLYFDEFAFIKPHIADEFIASVFPTISSGKSTKVIITSCVTKDTYVFTNKGIQHVSDFIDDTNPRGGYEVPEYKVMGKESNFNNGYIMHNEGIANTRIINTKYRNIECSLEHKLWSCKNGK